MKDEKLVKIEIGINDGTNKKRMFIWIDECVRYQFDEIHHIAVQVEVEKHKAIIREEVKKSFADFLFSKIS